MKYIKVKIATISYININNKLKYDNLEPEPFIEQKPVKLNPNLSEYQIIDKKIMTPKITKK